MIKDKAIIRVRGRLRRHRHVRQKVVGTPERPRLSVYRSLRHIHAQLIDDVSGTALVRASSLCGEIRQKAEGVKGKCTVSREVGKLLAERAKAESIERVVFDRGGYLYHGRVKALADGAREGGLVF